MRGRWNGVSGKKRGEARQVCNIVAGMDPTATAANEQANLLTLSPVLASSLGGILTLLHRIQ